LHGLVSCLLAEVVSDHSLEGVGSVALDFFLENLDEALVEGALEFAGAVASSAWEALLVDLGAVASETD
jgi:hypothetical protein